MGSSSPQTEAKEKKSEPEKKNNQPNQINNIYFFINQPNNFPSDNSTFSNSNINNMNDINKNMDEGAPPASNQINSYDNKESQNFKQLNLVIKSDSQGNKIIFNNSNKDVRNNIILNNVNVETNKPNNNQETVSNTRNIDNNDAENKYNKPDYKLENGNKENYNFERNNIINKDDKKEIEENKKTKGDVNINFGGKDREFKENNKNPATKMGNIDANVGGYMKEYGGENWNTFTKTGNENNNPVSNNKNDEISKKVFTNTGVNFDNNVSASNIMKESVTRNVDNNQVILENLRKKELEESNLSLSQSLISSSYLNLDLTDQRALMKLKEIAGKKVQEGYFPFFIKLSQKAEFFFIKEYLTLKDFLFSYSIKKGKEYNGENVKLYNGNRLLDLNTAFSDLNINVFCLIENHP